MSDYIRQSQDQAPFHIFWHLECYIFLNIRDRRIFSQLYPEEVVLCMKNKQWYVISTKNIQNDEIFEKKGAKFGCPAVT